MVPPPLVLKTRLATAAIAIPILIWLIFGAPLWLYRTVVLLLTLVGLAEYFRMAFRDEPRLQMAGLAAGALVAATMTVSSADATGSTTAIGFGGAVMGVMIVGLIASLASPEDPHRAIQRVGIVLLGVLYGGALLPHFIWLRSGVGDSGPAWVVFVIAVAMAGDSAAYFAGRAYGRRPLMPAVSPKKTVEGAIGAIGGNLVSGAVVKALFLSHVGWAEVFCLSLIAGALAQVGDLCESLLKRAFGAKDSGTLFPGHGGVLDRADSLVFPIVFIYYHVSLFRG